MNLLDVIWKSFAVCLALIATWFSLYAVKDIYLYIRLTTSLPTKEITWEVEEYSEEKYSPKAIYSFVYNGKIYYGRTVFDKLAFRNEWSVRQFFPTLENDQSVVWFSYWDPNISSLQKSFPFKESLSAGILWCILIYFFILRRQLLYDSSS